jgi:hypothetical protein
MTKTYSLDHVVTSTESVKVEVAAKSEMVLQSTATDQKTGAIASTYVLASGDIAFPATVVYRTELQKRGGELVRRASVTFNTWAVRADDVAETEVRKPISGTFAFVLPSDMNIELADLDDFIGNVFSFLYASQSSGARNTGYLAKILFGIPQVV